MLIAVGQTTVSMFKYKTDRNIWNPIVRVCTTVVAHTKL